MAEFREYLDLREKVINGSLFLLRNELIHLLYKLYIKLMRKYISEKVMNKYDQREKVNVEKLVELKKDFSDIENYTKEIEYQIPILENVPTMEAIQKDEFACKILTRSSKIKVSQYTFEILMALTEKNHYKSVESLFFNCSNKGGSKIAVQPQLEVIQNGPEYQALIEISSLNTGQTKEHQKSINQTNYEIGIPSIEHDFITQLDQIYHSKVKDGEIKNIDGNKINLQEDNGDMDIESFPGSDSVYKKSDYKIEDLTESYNKKLKYNVDFGLSYLNRNYIDENNEPHILRVNLQDQCEKVSCVCMSQNFDILAIGKMSCKIKVYYFKEMQEEQDSQDASKNKINQTLSNPEEIVKPRAKEAETTMNTCTLVGHKGPVTSMSASYDSNLLLTASTDCDIRLWCLRQGACLAVYKSHIRTVWSVNFCSLGTHFVSGGKENMIFVWSTLSEAPLCSLIGHREDVLQVQFTKNRNYICSISCDKTFRVWDLENNGEIKRIIVLKDVPNCFELDNNSEFVIIGTLTGQIAVYDLKDISMINLFQFNCLNLDSYRIKGSEYKKIRNIKFSVDDKMVIINDKSKLAYFTKTKLIEKNKELVEGKKNEGSGQKVSKTEQNAWEKVVEGQKEIKQQDESVLNKFQVEPLNFIYNAQMNIVANQPTIKNIFACVCFTNDDA